MRPRTCPPETQLHAFQLGDLPEPALNEVAEHLEECPQCEARARESDTHLDAILAALRDPAPVVNERTRCLGPTAANPPLRAGDSVSGHVAHPSPAWAWNQPRMAAWCTCESHARATSALTSRRRSALSPRRARAAPSRT